MSESITAYCRNCKEQRTFYLEQEDPLKDTFKCYNCGLRKNRKTLLGWGVSCAGAIISIGAIIIGIPKPPTPGDGF